MFCFLYRKQGEELDLTSYIKFFISFNVKTKKNKKNSTC